MEKTGEQKVRDLYWLEVRHGNVIVQDIKQSAPIPRYEIGDEFEIEGAVAQYYVVRNNHIGVEDRNAKFPRRQTLIVEPIDRLTPATLKN